MSERGIVGDVRVIQTVLRLQNHVEAKGLYRMPGARVKPPKSFAKQTYALRQSSSLGSIELAK